MLTKAQRDIFDKVKKFVLENTSASHIRAPKLSLPNVFPSRDRTFIAKLSEDLYLDVTWDEYDEQDQNLVTWRLPQALCEDDSELLVESAEDEDTEWEDAEDDAEARAAVDRVLKKYEKAFVADPDAEGTFDERHERSIKEKMDAWKRDYYRV